MRPARPRPPTCRRMRFPPRTRRWYRRQRPTAPSTSGRCAPPASRPTAPSFSPSAPTTNTRSVSGTGGGESCSSAPQRSPPAHPAFTTSPSRLARPPASRCCSFRSGSRLNQSSGRSRLRARRRRGRSGGWPRRPKWAQTRAFGRSSRNWVAWGAGRPTCQRRSHVSPLAAWPSPPPAGRRTDSPSWEAATGASLCLTRLATPPLCAQSAGRTLARSPCSWQRRVASSLAAQTAASPFGRRTLTRLDWRASGRMSARRALPSGSRGRRMCTRLGMARREGRAAAGTRRRVGGMLPPKGAHLRSAPPLRSPPPWLGARAPSARSPCCPRSAPRPVRRGSDRRPRKASALPTSVRTAVRRRADGRANRAQNASRRFRRHDCSSAQRAVASGSARLRGGTTRARPPPGRARSSSPGTLATRSPSRRTRCATTSGRVRATTSSFCCGAEARAAPRLSARHSRRGRRA
mmetsp:Transcript_11764/g.38946  ORF Transcript_11764/g.38946 Transcript_11764/m.38946 type:complete len:463 (-) Transcript_11764:1039-2427(-)